MCLERSRREFRSLYGPVNPYRPVYVPEKIDKIVFVIVEVLRSSYWPVYVPGTIEKAVFTAVEAL